jgi:hypothetical protein
MPLSMINDALLINEWQVVFDRRVALIGRNWVVAVEGQGIRVRPPGAIRMIRWRSHKRTIVHDRILRRYVFHRSARTLGSLDPGAMAGVARPSLAAAVSEGEPWVDRSGRDQRRECTGDDRGGAQPHDPRV